MIAQAAALLLLATSPAADAPPPDCEDYHLFCDEIVAPALLKHYDVPPARLLAEQGYAGIRVFTMDGYGGHLPMVSVLRREGELPRAEAHDAGKSAREVTATEGTWRAAAKLSAELKAGPGSYSLADPNALCLHPWDFAIEVIDADGVTVRARNTCALEQTGIDAQALANAVADDMPGCERLSRDSYRGIPAYRLRVCLSLASSRRGAAADAVNAWEASPMADGVGEGVRPEDWLTPNVVLDWPDRGAIRGRDAVAKFWRIVTNEDFDKSASDFGLGEASVVYGAARATSDRRVRITGAVKLGPYQPEGDTADFVQEWALGDDGRWRLAAWEVGDITRWRR